LLPAAPEKALKHNTFSFDTDEHGLHGLVRLSPGEPIRPIEQIKPMKPFLSARLPQLKNQIDSPAQSGITQIMGGYSTFVKSTVIESETLTVLPMSHPFRKPTELGF
jgi:hypothetical protein